jgi:dipeptidyl aminopeptidase/acylaminoacyl peptidase
MLSWILTPAFAADPAWMSPPDPLGAILDAPPSPNTRWLPGPDVMLVTERDRYPPIAVHAAPTVALAGLVIDPRTGAPARTSGATSARIVPLSGKEQVIPLPDAQDAWHFDLSPDGRRLMFTTRGDDGFSLWVADLSDPTHPRQLVGPTLQVATGAPCAWLPGDDGLVCTLRANTGPAPERPLAAPGPRIEESIGRKAPSRTLPNLLQDHHDELLFDHHLAASLVRVGLDGVIVPLHAPAVISAFDPSPDGRYVLLTVVERPYSRAVSLGRFPDRTTVIDAKTGASVVEVSARPLADEVPIADDSTRTGRRAPRWRSDHGATLVFTEALDGGDGAAEVPLRDAVWAWPAPFSSAPSKVWASQWRAGSIVWGNDHLAFVWEQSSAAKRVRWWRLDPSVEGGAPVLLSERSDRDAYTDPGSPLTKPGPYGRSVLRIAANGDVWLAGNGASPDGVYPFLDRFDPVAQTATRVFRSADPWYERVVTVLDDEASRLLTVRESIDTPPEWGARKLGKSKFDPLVRSADPAPMLAGLEPVVLTHQRADGVSVTGNLYLPPGYDPKKNGPLPTLLWVYPDEFKDRSVAGQVRTSTNTFSRPSGSSPLMMVALGWAVLSNPTLPIVGEGSAEPNDTYVDQLVQSASAWVDRLVADGVSTRGRLAVGGHSYGAFTTANLLAHSDLFFTGIARSGAYNRTLTPFGFQGEDRSLWDAPETYVGMSPFTFADRIDEPLLMIHGAEDPNPGTWPMQSARMYDALKGNGARARWVELPHEEHGYTSREAVGHTLYEMATWLDRWLPQP